MDILFAPTPDATRAVAAAILAIATNLPGPSEERDEAEAALQQAMAGVAGRTPGDDRKKVRCRVSCCDGRTTVFLLDPATKAYPTLLARSPAGAIVYSAPGRSVWLVDELQR